MISRARVHARARKAGRIQGLPRLFASQGRQPSALAADTESDGGANVQMTFRRVIVWPGGRKEVEGVTPKQLPPPSSHTPPNSVENTDEPSE